MRKINLLPWAQKIERTYNGYYYSVKINLMFERVELTKDHFKFRISIREYQGRWKWEIRRQINSLISGICTTPEIAKRNADRKAKKLGFVLLKDKYLSMI